MKLVTESVALYEGVSVSVCVGVCVSACVYVVMLGSCRRISLSYDTRRANFS